MKSVILTVGALQQAPLVDAKKTWQRYYETALLGEGTHSQEAGYPKKNVRGLRGTSMYRPQRRVYLPANSEKSASSYSSTGSLLRNDEKIDNSGQSPLRSLQLTSTPTTSFTVEECANLSTIPIARRGDLATGNVKYCILAFGKVLLSAHKNMDTCNMREEFIYAANVMAQNLDLDADGTIDDANVANALDVTRTTGEAAAFFILGCQQTEEEVNGQNLGYGMSAQAWKTKNDGAEMTRSVLLEETFHWAHNWAWASVYPNLVGYQFTQTTSSLVKCHKKAQCEWWVHPENKKCSNSAGVACANPDMSETTSSIASYTGLTAGQCMEGECKGGSCDVVEFFHKMYFAVIKDNRASGYRYVKAAGGNEPSFSNKMGSHDAFIDADMAASTECAAFLNELTTQTGAGKTYKLPTTKYLDTYSVAAATNAPATNAPATNAPATNAPATNAPATNAPATNAPATNAPATNAPATNAPVTPSAVNNNNNNNNNAGTTAAPSSSAHGLYNTMSFLVSAGMMLFL